MLRKDIISRRDTELFGFGKKYKLDCTTGVLNILSNYWEFEFTEKGLSYLDDEDPNIRFDVEECDEVSDYIELVLRNAKKDSNILTKSTKIENDTDDDKWELAKKNKIDYFYEPEYISDIIENLSKNKRVGYNFFKSSLESIKLGLHTYNDIKIKNCLNRLKESIGKAINYIDSNVKLVEFDSEEMDAELFGFGKKYESELEFYKFDDYINIPDTVKFKHRPDKFYNIQKMVIQSTGESGPIGLLSGNSWVITDDLVELASDVLDERINEFKKHVNKTMRGKVKLRIVKPDSFIGDGKEISNLEKRNDGYYKAIASNINEVIRVLDSNDKLTRKRSHNTLLWMAKAFDDILSGFDSIRSFLNKNIKETTDKESIDLESITNVDTGLVDLCYTPVSYADIESFAAISGLVSNGFKKLTNVVNDITSRFTVYNPDYSKMTSSFIFSKDRRYQDVYNLLVGVPKGFNGYLTDVCKHLENNISYVNILDNELDGIITTLSTYINSAEYRESFIIDLTKTKSLETNATSLYNENKKIITESRDDSRPVGKLLKSANDIDIVVSSLKQLSKQIDMNQLDSIKFKMKQIDDLVSTMVNNKNNYSKNKLLEIARMIDATISLSNGVGTLLFIKSSVDTIILDIKELI